MSISCGCDYDGDYFTDPSQDFNTMPRLKRRKRCMSCGVLLNPGDDVLQFENWRYPRNDIEESICGDKVLLADTFLCEECGEIYMNLDAAGMCIIIDGDLHDDLRTYWEMTDFDPDKYTGENHANEF